MSTQGTHVWKNGQTYVGSWEQGEPGRRATDKFVDESGRDGYWKDGTHTSQAEF